MVKKVILENEYEKYRRLLGIDEELKKNFEGFVDQARKLYIGCRDDKVLLERLSTKFKKNAEIYQELVGIKAYSPGYQKNPADEAEPPVPPAPPAPPVLASTTETPVTTSTPVIQELPLKN